MASSDILQNQPSSLDEWAAFLSAVEMPIFSNTAQSIYVALDDKNKGAMELASIILQDPNLTAKVLKVANSPYYNPSRQKISTVSRAIVFMGSEMIRELTLACSFFEAILSTANKERANKEIALAIHAATQARELAILLNDTSPEEVFIAALLHNIGHVVFWCSGHKQTIKVHELLASSGLSALDAEKKVLGFSLMELAKKLSKFWHLGGLIESAINNPNSTDKRIRTVCIGSRICEAIKQGWDSEAMAGCLKDLQGLSGESIEILKAKIKANTARAVDIARQFGAHDASQLISQEYGQPTVEIHEEEHLDKKQIQFQVLQDIASHISDHVDLNVLFEMVMEGIYRGVEMDRALFMLLSPDKKTLKEKISLGWQRRADAGKIQVYNNDVNGNVLFHALNQPDGLWFNPAQHGALYSQQINFYFGRHECFVFSIQLEEKTIGMIYCDRGVCHQALTAEDFSAAKHFAKQAQIGLTLYRMKTHKS